MNLGTKDVPRLVIHLPVLLIGGAAIFATALYLAGVRGGFDFTDEGFYYLSFAHPEYVSDSQSSFYFFGSKIFALLGHSIVAMRVATLAAVGGGTMVFLRGFRSYTTRFAPDLFSESEHRWLGGVAALIAALLGFAISPAALSYNFQNAFCLLAACGLLLSACAHPPSAGWLDLRSLPALAGFGALAGLDFFIKFSTSVPLAVGGLAFFLLFSPQTKRQKIVLVGILALCLAVPAGVYFTWVQNWTHWREGIAGTLGALVEGGYATTVSQRYAQEIIAVALPTLRNFAPAWVVAVPAMLIVPGLRKWPKAQAVVAALGGFWTLGHLAWLIDEMDYLRRLDLEFFIGSLGLLLVLAIGSHLAGRNAARPAYSRARLAALGLLLLLLPYLGAFGTSNNINTNAHYQLAPWLVLAALLLAEIDRVWGTLWPSRVGLLLLSAMTAAQFYQGYWVQPYRMGGNRSAQTAATSIGEPASILQLTPTTHEFITSSRRILQEHGFKPGDDLLVFFDLPGFVFAMGGASPGHPWYFAGDNHSLDLDAMRLTFIAPDRRRRAFIVRNGLDPDWNDFLPRLRTTGLKFPEDYRLLTPPEMVSPFTRVPFQIWAPKTRLPLP